jgi:N utilization substance protein A
MVQVSRTNSGLVKRLFEQEGTVEVKSIAREPGVRSKMAVHSRNPHVDPVGACVGQSGYRVNVVSNELKGEKLDIIQWSADPVKYIAAALSPSRVNKVAINPYDMTAKVIVPDHQLSLAIGKEGQNARLAARLTGWRIDIKSETQAKEIGFISDEDLNVDYEAFLEEKAQAEAKLRAAVEAEKAEVKEAVETTELEAVELTAELEIAAESSEDASEVEAEIAETEIEIIVESEEAKKAAEGYGDDYYDDDAYYDDEYDDDYYDDEYDDEYYDDEYDDDYYEDDYEDNADAVKAKEQ